MNKAEFKKIVSETLKSQDFVYARDDDYDTKRVRKASYPKFFILD